MLVTLNQVLPKAREEHYAVPAFDCMEDVMVRTVLDTAEQEKSPVIIMALEHDLQGRGMTYISGLVRAVADSYDIPVVLHLDHAENLDIIRKAIDYGFTSVMYDGSQSPFRENVERSREVVEIAHGHDVSVEAELGLVAGKDIHGDDYPGDGESLLTDPEEVVEFVEQTGVDALAVSIGTSHGVYVSLPNLDMTRLKEINTVSKVPLVLHGGSNTPVDQLQNAIHHGISKINVYADLRVGMLEGLQNSATSQMRKDPLPDVLFRPIQKALSQIVAERMGTFFSKN
ncbi:MAG: class II fructose-bisphosphate aldolase [bacterium]|nr:class II fructose-bisphosphate aldolase [bacterium]